MKNAAVLGFFLAILLHFFQFTSAIHKEIFTTNAVCSGKHCINPIFPGLEAINTLATEKFKCNTLSNAQPSLNFCSGAVDYNPSLPYSPGADGKTVSELVSEQEQKAMTTYFLHLNAMGLEAWDYAEPQSNGDDPCIQSVWRLACYTYFPRTPRNCQTGQEASYIRPCASSCANYVNQCRVECCDESVQCSFEHSSKVGDTTITTFGFAPHEGPSMFCTGSASGQSKLTAIGLAFAFSFVVGLGDHLTLRSFGTITFILLSGLWGGVTSVGAINVATGVDAGVSANLKNNMILASSSGVVKKAPQKKVVSLVQTAAKKSKTGIGLGTGVTVSHQKSFDLTDQHTVGNWRKKSDYLIEFQYVPPGSTSTDAILNSCSLPNLAPTLQCNGRGQCKTFNPTDIANPVLFCECERDYADPECRTKRKSQVTAYFLSLFFGLFGVDRFYLGFPVSGALKLISLGGFGFWWLVDIVYIGSAPVYAGQYRLAANLPHWFFVASSVSISVIIGFVIALCSTKRSITEKRRAAFLYHAEEANSVAADFGQYPSGLHKKSPPQPQVRFPPKPRDGNVPM